MSEIIGERRTVRDQNGNISEVYLGPIPEADVSHGEKIGAGRTLEKIASLVAEAKARCAAALVNKCRCDLCCGRLWDLVERNNKTIETIQWLLDGHGQTTPGAGVIQIGSLVRFRGLATNVYHEGTVMDTKKPDPGEVYLNNSGDLIFVAVLGHQQMFCVWKDHAVLIA